MEKKKFQGVIDKSIKNSVPHWEESVRAPKGSPNVVVILLDDAGFADFGCYGSEIQTPNIDRLASNGLRYNNFTTTAVCSPTRASLLTGLNHHSAGVGWLAHHNIGYPGYAGQLASNTVTLAEVLRDNGYSTLMIGKWHLTAEENLSSAGPFDSWPTQRGFDRYWGFLEGEQSQWFPNLISGNEYMDIPLDGSFYFPDAMTDKAIGMIKDLRAVEPEKPFFLYYATAAPHAPHHTKPEDVAKYKGVFDKGWDAIRAERLKKMKEMGIVPQNTELAPHNPWVKPWEELNEDEQRMAARFQENYAAFIDNLDQNVGRLLEFIEKIGEIENTLVILFSDNGASAETTPGGTINRLKYFNGIPETTEENLKFYESIGGVDTWPHYNLGWTQASNTPFKFHKRTIYAGGVHDPFIISWPKHIKDSGTIRTQFHHVTDIMPTILEAIGLEQPSERNGQYVKPIEGESMHYTFEDAETPSRKPPQYYEIEGHRAMRDSDWKIIAHRPIDQFLSSKHSYDSVEWELYNLSEDFSELNDLAAQHPEKVAELEALWWKSAEKYNVLPIVDIPSVKRNNPPIIKTTEIEKTKNFTYYPGTSTIQRSKTPAIINRSFSVDAEIKRMNEEDEGVIVAHGSLNTGYTFYIQKNRLVFEYNMVGNITKIISNTELPTGTIKVGFQFIKTGLFMGEGYIYIDGKNVGKAEIKRTFIWNPWEGIDIGKDTKTPVTRSYSAPFPFRGQIEKVEYHVKLDTSK